jgi:DNA-binding NtrC family response regulator
VLIVDDEAGVRELLMRWLAPVDCTLCEAADAESAWQLLKIKTIAVVVCDLSMPGRGGEWLVGQIREQFPTVAVVLATSDDGVPSRVSLQRGIVGYLVKPFERTEVLNSVTDALVWHRAAVRQADRKLGNTKGGE